MSSMTFQYVLDDFLSSFIAQKAAPVRGRNFGVALRKGRFGIFLESFLLLQRVAHNQAAIERTVPHAWRLAAGRVPEATLAQHPGHRRVGA